MIRNQVILSKEHIQTTKLLEGCVDSHYKVASYDLSIEGIVDLSIDNDENTILGRYTLKPGGMVLVFSKEVFNLPDNVLGMTTVKNALSNKGVMAVNIGLVDPGYIGPISGILINFGPTAEIICDNDPFLRMTFHKTNETRLTPNNSIIDISKIKNEYIDRRLIESNKNLNSTFLSLGTLEKNILEKSKQQIIPALLKQISYFLIIVSLIVFLLDLTTDLWDKKELGEKIDKIEKKINKEDSPIILKKRIDELEEKILKYDTEKNSNKKASVDK